MWSSKHAINDMHVSIIKLQGLYAKDYHDHKIGGHNIVVQSIGVQQIQWCWVMIKLSFNWRAKQIWRYIMKGGN
jgi:hypothetical protein